MGHVAEDLRPLALGVLTTGFVGTELPGWLAGLLREGLAGAWLFGQNVADVTQVRAVTGAVHEAAPHALVCSDEEGGTVTRLHHREGSPWPSAWALGRGEPAATRAVYEGLGRDVAAAGIDLGASPVADVNTEPRNPVIGVRSFGPDPGRVARHVAAAVAGLRAAGVLSCAKHFPGHGSTRLDSHVALPVLEVTEETLRARELLPFRAAVAAGVDVVMTGHLVVPGFGQRPATLTAALMTLLREEFGFTGVICTDALDMAAVAQEYGRARGAVLALGAGVDLVCIGNPAHPEAYDAHADTEHLAAAIVAAVLDGELPEQRLREAAARVRRLGKRQAARRAAGTPAPDPSAPGARSAKTPSGADHPGLAAARRAVVITGTPVALHAPTIVGASTAGNAASGARQEVILRVLADALGGTWCTVAQPEARPEAAGTPAGPVVAVCDDHTDLEDPGVRRLLDRAAAVVHTGVRPLDGVEPSWLVRTYSGGAAGGRAAAAALAPGIIPEPPAAHPPARPGPA